jgi:surface antigen
VFRIKALAAACGIALLIPAQANALQCVPFARQVSGINIFGNAKTWWYQAEGRYARGAEPRVGAVMTFKPTRSMPMGHVGKVSKIVSDREVLIDHANWSRIGGRRGHIERGARVLDVSPAGDWSQVRVWYAPMKGLGTSTYPLYGFIYNDGEGKAG